MSYQIQDGCLTSCLTVEPFVIE